MPSVSSSGLPPIERCSSMPPIPNMPPITPHETKKCNKCLATKTLDHFTDLRRAFGVIRITVQCDTCRAKCAARRKATRRDDGNGDGTSPSSSVPRSGQHRSATVSGESKFETDMFTPPVESNNVLQTPRAPANHPPDVPHPGLPLDPVQVAGELDVPCLTDADQRLLRNFERALAKNKLMEWPRCLIRWLTIELNRETGICQDCTKDDTFRARNPQLPALWSEANGLDPGEPPEHLEAFGHPHPSRRLRVRRPVVAAWLRHLKANHDGYSDVTIDEDVLSQLPDDGDVNAELQTKDVGPEDLEYLIAEIENDDLGYDVSAIPDLGADETELDRLRGITRRGQGELKPSSHIASATGPQGLQMPAIRSTPISDIRVKARGSYHWLIRCCIPGGRVTSRRLGSARSTANPTCSICFGCLMGALPGILCGVTRVST
ncbi:hypothetical protein E4U50_002583 [Claviceps purpurea]|nr:hypothetical protein E4U50_002583 [Claviceps purpurea]